MTPGRAELVLGKGTGTRSNHAHLPGEHVEKLRQLVEMEFAKHSPDPRKPGIISDVKLRAVGLVVLFELQALLLGISIHGSEFETRELAPAARFAPMDEEDRPAILQKDRQKD